MKLVVVASFLTAVSLSTMLNGLCPQNHMQYNVRPFILFYCPSLSVSVFAISSVSDIDTGSVCSSVCGCEVHMFVLCVSVLT
jgi:hypothetical protein